jgi:hypothetical protein
MTRRFVRAERLSGAAGSVEFESFAILPLRPSKGRSKRRSFSENVDFWQT